ncbi:hypothetical protein ACERII_00470 [Evansella sp. AB-rgal1]|uniref:hypothetical protein n=1 Tax=Evansella sp. AB-rgal1 TaxID=3242696 RepID=UPI00359E2684
MRKYEKDFYFEQRDKLIKKLPEPEKSVFLYFRKVEKAHLEQHGRLIVNGKTPIKVTAEHFMMSEGETKKVCLRATILLKEMMQK